MREEVERSAEILRDGGILLYPASSWWALGVDATNSNAVGKLIRLINHDQAKGFPILVERDARLMRHVEEVPEIAWDLIDLSEEPLTIIYPNGKGLAQGICGLERSVGIQFTKDPFCSDLIKNVNRPIVSTSANFEGEKAPSTFKDIAPSVLDGVHYAVNLRRSERLNNMPSRIIKLDLDGTVQIIR